MHQKPSLAWLSHPASIKAPPRAGIEHSPTLGGRASPPRQFISMRCCRRKASFQGLYMKPGLRC